MTPAGGGHSGRAPGAGAAHGNVPGGGGHAGGGAPPGGGAGGGGHGGGGHGGEGSFSNAESGPRERSAPLPATTTPAPPEPLIAPQGNVPMDMLGHIVNRFVEPFQDLPNQPPLQKVQTVVNGVIGVLNMDVLVDAFNAGVALVTAPLNAIYPAMPAATLTALHVGTPHTHPHPPSTVPPAPPIPLPSIGNVMVGGCVSVLIGGLPAARAGDLGLAMTCVSFSPPFEIYTGSSKVFIGGSRAARMGDITKHCGAASTGDISVASAVVSVGMGLLGAATAPNAMAAGMAAAQTAVDLAKMAVAALMGKDPGAPPCIGAIMMGSPTVLIGGIPLPPLENSARAFFMKLNKPLAKALHSLIGKALGKGRLANFFHAVTCHLTGHPVDVASGRMMTWEEELTLPGPIPFVWKRQYATSWSERNGPLGWGWSHSFDLAIWRETGKTIFLAEDGREIEFDHEPEPRDKLPWLKPNERWDRFNKLILRELRDNTWEVESIDGLVRVFALLQNDRTRPGRARLVAIRDRFDHTIGVGYDAVGNLATIVDSAGRMIRVEADKNGRVSRVLVPAPEGEGMVEYIRYEYSPEGDLGAAFDALGQPMRMEYDHHLMKKETRRGGLSFHFVYEGRGNDARCIATWGDGGIYKRTIVYDTQNHTTIVTDSRDATTVYQMNADNAVASVTDALGAVTKYEYDDSYNKLAETDPLEHTTRWQFDERGNCTKIGYPHGAEISLAYDERNLVCRVTDAMKGKWRWEYDPKGRILLQMDALNRITRFEWQSHSDSAIQAGRAPPNKYSPTRLVAVIDPAGNRTALDYDVHGNVVLLRNPDHSECRWSFDRLGRCTRLTDALGNQQQRQYDVKGRLTAIVEPDGNRRVQGYDRDGNLTSIRDQYRDITLEYQGMGRVSVRKEAGAELRFDRNHEDQIVVIHNQEGATYSFTFDTCGRMKEETGFDGVTRKYTRDQAGRITRIDRPGGRTTEYVLDAAGRVVETKYGDGNGERFVFRPDGLVVEATNRTTSIKIERDLLGRLLTEHQGESSVTSDYDLLGLRKRLTTSQGLRLTIHRSTMGDANEVLADATPGSPIRPDLPAWQVRFTRNSLGQEIERIAPGDARSRWERDQLGRPAKHEILTGQSLISARSYSWQPDTRLQMLVDAAQGPTRYAYDPLGNLIRATDANDHHQLRVADAVGNLYRTADRSDREYGPGGRLLAAHDPEGTTTYEYDPEGNVVRKRLPDGSQYCYVWADPGVLAKVARPDGSEVEFAYDAFGRRLRKKVGDTTTHWRWDGNVPVHEWVVHDPTSEPPAMDAGDDEAHNGLLDRKFALTKRLPRTGKAGEEGRSGTADQPITWIFEPGTYSPLAKLQGDRARTIITDHVGAPIAMLDERGSVTWSGQLGIYGDLRQVDGVLDHCPFRWPGQYEDTETGLYYNRFRYFDPASGTYVSQDPLGLNSGVYNPYSYVRSPVTIIDPLGIDWNYILSDSKGPYYTGRASEGTSMADVARRHSETEGTDGFRFREGDTMRRVTPTDTPKDTVRGLEQRGIEERSLLGRGSEEVRGNLINGMSEAKQATEKGTARLAAADEHLNGKKLSELPALEEYPAKPKSDCGG